MPRFLFVAIQTNWFNESAIGRLTDNNTYLVMKRVLLVSSGNPRDKRQWSGIEYSIYQQLMKYYDLDVLTVKVKWGMLLDKLRMRATTFGRRHHGFGLLNSYLCSKRVQRKLNTGAYDAAFVFGCSNTAFIKTSTPIVYFTDATTHVMQGYYWNYGWLLAKEADFIQGRCLRNNTINLAASSWALEDMVNYFEVSRQKCMLCQFGANVEIDNTIPTSKGKGKDINILFVGAEWERKGGDIAIDTLRRLKEMDKDRHFKLHMVGKKPEKDISEKDVTHYGFLNRNIPEQEALHTKLFKESDIFLLPTKAECAGIVFCEASAYGIPCVTYDTGGIADYVMNGVNGFRLAPGASGKEFAETILNILNTPSLKDKLSEGGKKLYKDSLNWDACGKTISSVIERLTEKSIAS